MIRDVVDIGLLSEHLGTLLKIDTHDDAILFGGFVNGDADEELASQLQRRGSVRGAIYDIGQCKTQLAHRIKVENCHG
jgi:hypothetical protein